MERIQLKKVAVPSIFPWSENIESESDNEEFDVHFSAASTIKVGNALLDLSTASRLDGVVEDILGRSAEYESCEDCEVNDGCEINKISKSCASREVIKSCERKEVIESSESEQPSDEGLSFEKIGDVSMDFYESVADEQEISISEDENSSTNCELE